MSSGVSVVWRRSKHSVVEKAVYWLSDQLYIQKEKIKLLFRTESTSELQSTRISVSYTHLSRATCHRHVRIGPQVWNH